MHFFAEARANCGVWVQLSYFRVFSRNPRSKALISNLNTPNRPGLFFKKPAKRLRNAVERLRNGTKRLKKAAKRLKSEAKRLRKVEERLKVGRKD